MDIRQKLLMGATALLYLGPLLAGMGDFGWSVVPVFGVIFALWLLVMRPQDRPHSLSDLRARAMMLRLGLRIAVLVVLVVLLFGVGRGIGGVLGVLPQLPVVLPLGISALAIPLSRVIWAPRQVGLARRAPGGPDHEVALAITRPLADLPPATADTELTAHLTALTAQLSAADLTRALEIHAARSWAARRSLELLGRQD